jgi:hypothetical protein
VLDYLGIDYLGIDGPIASKGLPQKLPANVYVILSLIGGSLSRGGRELEG